MHKAIVRIFAAAALITLSIVPVFGSTAYAFSSDTLLSGADASFLGEAADDNAGFSIASAGDVNNDGYDDFLVGAYGFDYLARSAAGKTYLFLGKPTGWATDFSLSNADASFIGEDLGDLSGYSVAGVGDVNNDSYDDFLIGASGDEDGGANAGQTYLILGKETGWAQNLDLATPGVASASFIGEAADDKSGSHVAAAGDVNNDGYDDFIISAPFNDDVPSNAGKIYLILGKETGWAMDTSLANADASYRGESSGDEAGSSIAPAGDVNGDSYDDFLIGSSQNDDGGNNAGQIYLILGKETGWETDVSLANANASFIGEAAEDQLSAVAGIGNVNGDEYDDFLIGAPLNDDGGANAGQTYLILGRNTDWTMGINLVTANASFIGENNNDESGQSLGGRGDINGDGYDDFLIGAYLNDDSGTDVGQTYLFLGKATANWGTSLKLTKSDASFIGENLNDKSGSPTVMAGDVNGDGGDDILISSYLFDVSGKTNSGKIYLLLGNSSPNAPTSPQSEGNTNPTGVRDTTPEFSWNFSDNNTGDSQSAYQILVSSSSANLNADTGDLWNSGKVSSTASSNIAYAGTALSWGTTYYWKVKGWDNHNAEGTYCAEQTFAMQTVPNAPTTPLCEGENNPSGVQDTTPEFGWTFSDPDDPDSQSAYQILVAPTSDDLAAGTNLLWDSGTVTSTSSTSVVYDGTALGTSWGTTYYWKVKTWDSSDAEGPYCAEQTFTMQVAPNAPTAPMCEGQTNPAALTDLSPEFTWTFSDDDNPDNQSAYQILVAPTSEDLAAGTSLLWDSGKQQSTVSAVTYGGTALRRGATYYWKVKTWDNLNAEGPYCAEQTFTIKSIVLPFWAEIVISATGAAAIGSGLVWLLMRRKSSTPV